MRNVEQATTVQTRHSMEDGAQKSGTEGEGECCSCDKSSTMDFAKSSGNKKKEYKSISTYEGRRSTNAEQKQKRMSGLIVSQHFESIVVLYNVAKRHNLGMIARSSTAFGVSEMILIGRKDLNAFGSHGATSHLRFRHFHSLSEAHLYLKERNFDICGVEIVDGASAVHTHPFKRNTAFMLGNEGTGLSQKEMSICDYFVYIPQFGPGTASLNVSVAASIVLHHFAGLTERIREGKKFVVGERPCGRRGPRNLCSEAPESVTANRLLQREDAAKDWLENEILNSEQAETLNHIASLKEPVVKASCNLSSLSILFDD
ncbi:hypothetical protein O6H91_07G006700 [Diphasiastrum complanatum]|uniref:Uncharacterized protein n=1 Tax=Diphasiastrum complanatum TaxID=34168 RepID=A0ACC2D223_DIPCM|nr:hypothetical protein O6H91_07G006700 [Diphasiastrum complanatum]